MRTSVVLLAMVHPAVGLILPPSALQTIQAGRIAVLPDFLPSAEVAQLRADAIDLHRLGHFSTDALSSYGKQEAFDPAKDRQVLRLGPWSDPALGDSAARQQFASTLAAVRASLADGLQRTGLTQGAAVSLYGQGSTEVSYTRFGPGASLKRHIDEHHEELKGKAGWTKPTRRSISWLVYLNEDWDPAAHQGALRCFERRASPVPPVGATPDGDLQLGWLRAVASDPRERPVFLDSRRHSKDGNCALYALLEENGGRRVRLSADFFADPLLFVAAGDSLVQRMLVDPYRGSAASASAAAAAVPAEAPPALFAPVAPRFHFLEPPKSKAGDLLASLGFGNDGYGAQLSSSAGPPASSHQSGSTEGGGEYAVRDVFPRGGTLVLFDSVALPHEVLAPVGRARFACSGWFHEDQQPEHHPA